VVPLPTTELFKRRVEPTLCPSQHSFAPLFSAIIAVSVGIGIIALLNRESTQDEAEVVQLNEQVEQFESE
jgi:hypothetical protein